MKAGAVRKLSGAEQRALAQQFVAADPKAEAWARESSFLGHLGGAQEDFDWIVANEAWTLLGHDTFADWWDARAPRMRELGFQPTRQIALAVLARIRSDEEKLPKVQRRTNRQLATSVGLSEASIRRIATRSLPAAADADADLEETSSVPITGVDTSRAAGEPDGSVKVAESSGTPLEDLGEDERDAALERLVGFPADHVGRRHYNRRGETVCHHDRREPRTPVLDQVDCMDCLRITAGINSPAAVTESDPTTQLASLPQPGQDSPTGQEEPGDAGASADATAGRSETDPPAVADQPIATEARPGIDHHDGAGVSPRGEALPEESRPSGALELEGGGPAQDPPSSGDPDDEDDPQPIDLVLRTAEALVGLLDHVDVDAVAPMLFPAELEQLHQHSEAFEAFVNKVSRVRFAEMTHTP